MSSSSLHSLVLDFNIYIFYFRGKDVVQKKVNALRELRRLLSRSGFDFVEVALKSGAIPPLAQCLSFGSEDEQVI